MRVPESVTVCHRVPKGVRVYLHVSPCVWGCHVVSEGVTVSLRVSQWVSLCPWECPSGCRRVLEGVPADVTLSLWMWRCPAVSFCVSHVPAGVRLLVKSVVFQDLKQPYQGQDNIGGVVESWPWFHIMDAAMQGRLYNNNLVLSPENGCNAGHRGNGQPNPNQENTDILEFLIKTEMEDAVATETAEDDGTAQVEATPAEAVPMGWRRMTECSYKSRQRWSSDCRWFNPDDSWTAVVSLFIMISLCVT